MAGIKHTFSVNIADDASAIAAGEVLPSHWNAEHTLSDVASQASLDAVSNAVSIVSTAASNALSVANAASQAASVVSNELSNVRSVLSQRISALSVDALKGVSISAIGSTHVLKWISAAAEWQNAPDATAGGGGSVTSTEASAISAQAASALSAALNVSIKSVVGGGGTASVKGLQSILNAVSNTLSNAFSAGSAISVRVDSIANAVSIVSTAASNALSVANAASNAASIVSVNLASVNSDIRSVVSQLNSVVSQGLSAMSNRISVVSNAVSIVSTAASNALSVANAASQAASVVSNAASNALSVANAASQAASVVSNELSNVRSILSQRISALSVDALKGVSISAVVSTHVLKWISAADEWQNAPDATAGGGGSVTSTEVSAVSQQASVNLAGALNVSIKSIVGGGGAASVKGLQSIMNAISNTLSNAFSAGSATSARVDSIANAVSIVSNAVSIVSTAASNALSVANAASQAASVVSARVASLLTTDLSVHSQQLSVHSQQLSVLSGKVSAGIGLSAQLRVRDASVFTVSTTGLTNITSLSVSVEAGGVYKIEAQLMISHSALNAYGIGMTYPGATEYTGLWLGNVSILTANGFAGVFSATVMGAAAHGTANTGATLLSGVAGSSAVAYNHLYRGLMRCSTAGVVQMQARVSLAGTPCIIHRGSYIRAYRIA